MAARLLIVTMLAGLLAVSAHAQSVPPLPKGPPPVERKIAAALFISPAGEPFRAGGDMSVGLAQWFAGADADHDGVLTLTEFQADHMRFFRLLDTRADGRVDGFDTDRYERTVAPEIGDPNVPAISPASAASKKPLLRIGKPPPAREGAARFSLLNEIQPLRTADLDYDYRISEAEWTAKAAQRFRTLDADHDGKLVLTELHLPPSPWVAQEMRQSQDLRDYYYIPYVWNPYF